MFRAVQPFRSTCAALWLAAVASSSAAEAAPDAELPVNAGGANLSLQVASLRAQRDAGVVKQRYDYSCGSAALATLLTFGLNDPVGEQALLQALLEVLPAAQLDALHKDGLSLADLQRLAQKRGHKAQGFRVHRSQLAALARPVIVFIKPRGYEHFAVLKGVAGERVHLADPSLGNVRMPLYRFLDMWADASGHGVIFVVERADGGWPERYALQLAGASGAPLEVLSARHLITSGRPLP
jgi:predicted double-glycine peptidase